MASAGSGRYPARMRLLWCLFAILSLAACQEPVAHPAPSSPADAMSAPPVAAPAQSSSPSAATALASSPAAPPSASATAGPPSPTSAAEPNKPRLHVRPLLVASSTRDPLELVLHWRTEDGLTPQDHPLGKAQVRWSAARFALQIEGPDGKASFATAAAETASFQASLAQHPSTIARLGSQGLELELPPSYTPETRTQRARAPWLEATPDLSKPGRYRIQVQATLEIGGARHLFDAAPVTVDRSASHKPVQEIERIALRALEARLAKRADEAQLSHAVRTVDLPPPSSQRLVRYSMPSPSGRPWHRRFYEVVVAPDGKVTDILEQERFTCVARGTPIATPSGPRAVEALRPADAVWGYDLEDKRRVVTAVRAISEPQPGATLRLARRLWLTPEHPVYRAGSWARAADLAPGDELLLLDGTPLALRSADRSLRQAQVYDLSVGPPHNYFAAGILVHNKRIAAQPGRFDVWTVLWERAIGEYQLVPTPAKAGSQP